MQKKKCMICIKAQRRYGKLDFSNTHEDFPNKLPTFGCQCNNVSAQQFHDNDSAYCSKNDSVVVSLPAGHPCSFCEESFPTATKLFFHTNNEHTMDNSHDDWDFYSVVGNSIIGNLDYFYYDQDKLYKLSGLIDALQMNVVRMKRLTTIEE